MGVYLRNQLAKVAGLNIETLRYYEKVGLISPQRLENGYRVYAEDAVARLGFIKRAKEAGFTLEEIRKTLSLFEYDMKVEELADVMAEGIAAKIAEMDMRIQRLMEIREVLTEIHKGLKERHVCPTMAPLLKRMGEGTRASNS
ncbi:MAG TPA: MerR family transcriptional regulator [Bacillota bacterium]|nr:MerR family transcriptional regulator [Bacillota bacterium]